MAALTRILIRFRSPLLIPPNTDITRSCASLRYVRMAGHAAKKAAMAPPQADPQKVVKAAVVDAAKKFAPGLLAPAVDQAPRNGAPGYPPAAPGPGQPEPDCPSCGGAAGGRRHHGKWVRRGRHIILLGV